MEPDAKPGAFLELASSLRQRDGSKSARTRGNRDAIAQLDVASDTRFDTILNARRLAGNMGFGLEADHRVARDHKILERLLWRLRRARRFRRCTCIIDAGRRGCRIGWRARGRRSRRL